MRCEERWNHNMCLVCWEEINPRRTPFRLRDPDPETCCFCGKTNTDGIYVRQDTINVPHPDAQEPPLSDHDKARYYAETGRLPDDE